MLKISIKIKNDNPKSHKICNLQATKRNSATAVFFGIQTNLEQRQLERTTKNLVN
jgi:hypothetical protein